METRNKLKGLYAITAPFPCDDRGSVEVFLDPVTQAIEGGARLIQYRDKVNTPKVRLGVAQKLCELCRCHGVLFIINDDVTLARQVAADGVHIGHDDVSLAVARGVLGPDAIIGVSCYNQLSLAQMAQQQGADYVAFGRFFPSRTKPDGVRADAGLLRLAKQTIHLPVVAIGGISADNGTELVTAGAGMLAVADAIFGAANPRRAAEQLTRCFL